MCTVGGGGWWVRGGGTQTDIERGSGSIQWFIYGGEPSKVSQPKTTTFIYKIRA